MELKKEEMLKISGGASKTGIIAGIISGIIFIFGVIDGIVRPLRCN